MSSRAARRRWGVGRRGVALVLLALPAGVPAGLRAQVGPSGAPTPTVGLVLSGGSAKGFAHVGVIEVLEEAGIRVDVVTGTSMGSVVGALYAIGTSTDSIKGLVRGVDWDRALSDDTGRERRFLHERRYDERSILTLPVEGGIVGLPTGVAVGSNIVRLAERATWPYSTVRSFDDLPRPFAAIAADIETGEAVVLRGGVLAEALRASSGIPGALEPFELGGRLLVDGLVARNLPAEDARALGADVVICSDVSDDPGGRDDLDSLLDVLEQVMTFSMQERTDVQRGLCDVLIRPDLAGLGRLDFARFEDWFERGRAAATRHVDALRDISTAQEGRPARPWPEALPDSVRISSVVVQGGERPLSGTLVRAQIGLEPGDFVDAAGLDDRLRNLDSTGLFGLVRYRLDREGQGVRVTVTIQERPRNRVGLGVRYDDERRAALLFSGTFHNLVRYGSVTRFDLRVGTETQARISYLRRHEVTGRLQGGTSLDWSQGELRLEGPTRPRSGIEMTRLSTTFGLSVGRTTFLGAEALGEWMVMDDGAYPDVLLGSVAGVLDHESLDRIDFPTRGTDVEARWEFGVSDLTEGGAFSLLTASGRTYIPLANRLTADLGFYLGSGRGLDLPLHRGLFVGGAHPSAIFSSTQPVFHGVPSQQLVGSSAQIARAGLRVRILRGTFLRIGSDVGGVMDEWRFPVPDPTLGWSLSVGSSTLLGPAVLEWSKAEGYDDRLTVRVGRRF